MKTYVHAVLLLAIFISSCTRNASEGKVVVQVLDFVDKQPLGLHLRGEKPSLSPMAKTATSTTETEATVCLVDSSTPPSELGTVDPTWECNTADVDGTSTFTREEGTKIALTDVNSDGLTDSITYDVDPGTRETLTVTTINRREDGGYLITENMKTIYSPGETIIIHVFGWLPAPESVHVELWNNWNSGFHYWSSEPRVLSGNIDFEVQMEIPIYWPTTNVSTGADYFSYPVGNDLVYNGDNFVLLWKGQGEPPAEGPAPTDPEIVLNDGAEAVSTTTVTATLSSVNATFYRMSNDPDAILDVPWQPLAVSEGTDVPWTLASGPDGEREVYVQYANIYGAMTEVVSDTIILDATPIEILNLQIAPDLGRQGTTFAFSFSLSEEAKGGLTVTFAGAPVTVTCVSLSCSGTYVALGTEPEGSAALSVTAIDWVGWTDRETTTVTLDFTPPQTLFTGIVPNGSLDTVTAAFGLASDELGITYECSLDGALFAACTADVSLTDLADGPHIFEARAIDPAGNVDPTPASTAWTVDITGPDTQIDSSPTGTVNVVLATFTFSSPAVDLSHFECRIDGGIYATCVSGMSINGLLDGSHTFEVRAVDTLGNLDTSPASVTWILDTGAPDTLIASAPTGTVDTNAANIVFYSLAADVAGYECSLDGDVFGACTNPGALTGLGDGPHTYEIRAYDVAGNYDATPAIAEWTVDTTPPDTTITAAPSGAITATTAAISFTASGPATFECRLDDALFAACASTTNLTGLGDGLHTFQVRAVDAVGNTDQSPASVSWTVDNTAPDTRIDSAPEAFTSSNAATLTFSSPSADVVSYECRRDTESFAPCTSAVNYTGLADGSHTFTVRAIDAAGNVDATPASTTWSIDTTPPDTTINGGPTGSVNTSTAAFTLTSNELATYECSLNGAAFAACPAALVYTGLADDDYTLEARAVDPSGAVDPTPATRSWTVDTTPPETTITQSPTAVTRASSATLAFSANETATFQCMLDGNAGAGFTDCANPQLYAGLTEGNHTFQVRAVDTAGNVDATPALAMWTVDTVAPLVLNLTANAAALTTGGTVTLSFDLSEAVTSVTVTVGGTTAVQQSVSGLHYVYTYSVTGAEPEGSNTVQVTVIDGAGNTGAANTTVTYDFTPPNTVTGPTLPPALSNTLTAIIDFSSTEANSTFECSLNGAAYTACTAPYMSDPLADGVYTLRVRAVDAVGLVDATPGEVVWEIDGATPDAPDEGRMTVVIHPAGTEDELVGSAGSVEPFSIVHVYADATLFLEVGTTVALADGSFVVFPIGDDSGDALQQIYVTSEDAAGNESAATPLLNPRYPPRLTRSLIHIAVVNDTNNNQIGNPGDQLEVTWDNSIDGDANTNITSATFTVSGLSLGPITMTDSGGGIYKGTVTLVEGAYDGLYAAQVVVFTDVGLSAGPVLSTNEANVDVELPNAVTDLVGSMLGRNLVVAWSPSTSLDVQLYLVFHGETEGDVTTQLGTGFVPSPLVTLTGEVPVCSEQYYAVRVRDDAGNESTLETAGPELIEVQPPVFAAWGNIAGIKIKMIDFQGADSAELHFSPVTETSTPPPWMLASTTYADSPVTISNASNTLISPLQAGTEYWLSARGVRGACTGEFSEPISSNTLGVLGHQGGVGICPGCCTGPQCTLPGRWYFGALGFAVAGVGDSYGDDGKEDILTAVPGQSLAILVSGSPMEEVGYVYHYYASLDVIGGGPMLGSAGDLNGDGKEEYIIGSPLAPTTSTGMKGMVRIIDGATKNTLVTQMGTANGMQLGYSVSVVGDVNGDGVADIIAGGVGCANFSCSDTTATGGTALVISGDGDGILRTHDGPDTGGFFGVSVHGGVDFNGDGIKDYVVGAPGRIGLNPPLGRVRVFSGASGAPNGGILLDLMGNPDEKFGFSVRLARAGSTGYVIVGAPSRSLTPGKVYVYDSTGSLFKILDGELPEGRENFGAALTSGGDIDGDGMLEIVVGDPNIPLSSQYGNGAAYIYKLTTGGYSGGLAYEISGGTLDGALGYGLDYISDVNGDGFDELVVGAPGAAVDGIFNAGRIYQLTVNP